MKYNAVKTNSMSELIEAIDLFKELGYKRPDWLKDRKKLAECVFIDKDYEIITGRIIGKKEITLPELRNLVVLKRNHIGGEKSLNDQYAEIEKVREKSVSDTLKERQKEYGSFEDVAFVTQGLIGFLSKHTNYDDMPNTHRESLHMIASKVARLTLGNCNHKDSWHDIGGYSKLIEDLLD